MTALHTTLDLERIYPVTPERVFAAWADPAAKARWLTGGNAEHRLDFRPGGSERVVARREGRTDLTFAAGYVDIVPNERIVYTGVLYDGDRPATVTVTTARFERTDEGTRLLLTEQGTFLDGLEQPDWREQGLNSQLDALGADLTGSPTTAGQDTP